MIKREWEQSNVIVVLFHPFYVLIPNALLFSKLAYALLLRKFAHKKRVVVLSNDISVESLDNNLLLIQSVYHTIVRIV